MKYQLVFQGELTAEVSQPEAVTVFAGLFKVSEDVARRRFFSGPVVLKNLDDFQQAIRYRERLRTMGIVASVTEVSEDASAGAGDTVVNSQGKGGVRKPLLWSAGVVALLLSLGTGLFIVASQYTDTSVPAPVTRAEAALLSPETVILGHANVRKLVKLEELLSDTGEDDYRYNPQGEGLLNTLLGQDVSPRRDLDQVVFSVGFSQSTGSYVSAVFLGQIDQEALYKGLQDYYQVTRQTREGMTILELSRQDRYTCEMSTPVALISNATTVVVSHPDRVLPLFRQVTGSHEPEVINQRWVDYRSEHLASIGVLQPDNLARGQQGIAGMMLQQMSGQLKGAESLFAGVSADLVPPAGSIDVVLNSGDAEWVAQTRSRLDTVLAAQRAEASGHGEFVAELLDNVTLMESSGVLGARFEVDGDLVTSGKEAFRDGIGGLFTFSGGGGFSQAGGGQALAEQLDENAEPYQAQIASLELKAFEPTYGRLYQWQEGPLAVSVSALRLNHEQQLELKMTAAAQGIPNAAGSHGGDTGSFRVLSVRDAGGQELIAHETCGREINSDPASFEPSFELGDLSADKTIRLVGSASAENIAVVEGELVVPVATKTETTLVAADSETTVEQGDMYFRLKSVEGSSVRFVVSGDRQRLLSVRALNADKQYLKSSSSSSMGDANGGTMNVTAQFQGEVAYVEVVSALEWTPVRNRFRITNTHPMQAESGYEVEPETVQPYELDDWPNVLALAETFEPEPGNNGWLGKPVVNERVAPGILSLFRPEVSQSFNGYGMRGYVKLDMPYVAAFDGQQGMAVFSVDELDFSGRDPISVEHEQTIPLSFTGFGGNYKNGNKTEAELRDDIYLDGQAQFSIPLGADGKSLDGTGLESLSGELTFHLPRAVRTLAMETVDLGNELVVGGTTLQVVGLATGSVSVSADGGTGGILKILVLNDAGKQIGSATGFSEEMRSGMQSTNADAPPRMIAKVSFTGNPASLRVVTVTDSVPRRYPVSLTIER